MTQLGKNICIAPFTQVTYAPFGSASPCPYLGGQAWDFTGKSLKEIWTSKQMESLRDSIKANQQDPTCNRCWYEESHGKQSARKLLLSNYKHKAGVIDSIKTDSYLEGPRQINLRVGNLCNLRCRPCNSLSSVTYAIEGKSYAAQGLEAGQYISFPEVMEFSDRQIDEIFEMTKNVRRIEFYGGEPLLDKPTLRLLEKLTANGKSGEITLFYNTNGVVLPTQQHLDLWKDFERIEFNFSIDGIGDHFTYLRHPGKWEDVLSTLEYVRSNVTTNTTAICTITVFNVYYIPEILAELSRLGLVTFLNLVADPKYYNIKNMPDRIKTAVIDKLKTECKDSQIDSIISILQSDRDDQAWQLFLRWTEAKDKHRGEDMSKTFPELYRLIESNDEFSAYQVLA